MIGDLFTTDYDEPAAALDELPVTVSSGQGPGVSLVDEVTRGRQIIGRVHGDRGVVGLRWRGGGVPVRVSLLLHLDEAGASAGSGPGGPSARLVSLRVRGETRGYALLGVGAKATAEFDLPAHVADGLLMIEITDSPSPPWATGRLAPRSAKGVRIDQISIRPRPDDEPLALPLPTRLDMAVLPPGAPRTFRLKGPPPPPRRAPSSGPALYQRIRRKLARGAAKALRRDRVAAEASRPRPPVTFQVLAADLGTGLPVDLRIVSRDADGVTVRRDSTAGGPLLIGLKEPEHGKPLQILPHAG